MRDIIWLFLLFICDLVVVSPSSVRRVRLIDHTSYAISIIQKTMSKVEQRCWCNLKVDDVHVIVNEDVLSEAIYAEVDLKDGFVVSIQKIGIIHNTIQQKWLPLSGNTTRVEVHSTVKMSDVAVGFNVIAKEHGKVIHSTGLIVYPDVQFQFTITKHLFTDEITVDVVGVLARTTNRMQFTPENHVTKVFTAIFNSTTTATSVERWARDILKPITLELATKEIEFPRICYNCAT
ncbi:uncharacterized protein LOC123869272 [Maniola jurtina]|uniref:uncharacterized protein LOC123869271 n=1 Tax=Maniola jurtina TaxID=191418 RepID=UPI001E68E23F|nr:uncharacterized protein LOC123869271 [Maniola jurtina]XP_045768066.1 uncharacterized protein LOC123869272 [Maniola jurtina]